MLPHQAGQIISNRQWCLSRGISNYDHKQGGLSQPSVPVASLHPGALVILILLRSMLPGVLGRLLHLLAFLLVILSARTLADTADVDRVMSESSMMTTRAQRLLHPEGVPGAPWQPPLTPGCESWCTQCTSQRCAVRGLHDLHMCMGCERAMTFSTPVGGGDPWAAPE